MRTQTAIPLFAPSLFLGANLDYSPPRLHKANLRASLRSVTRRRLLHLIPALLSSGQLLPRPAQALPTLFSSPPDLSKRFDASYPPALPAHRFQQDIYYPLSFRGVWKAHSTLVSSTGNENDQPLDYLARFIVDGTHSIADRAYNIASIASVSMGPQAVLSVMARLDNPDICQLSLRPAAGGGNVYDVVLKVIARHQQIGMLPPGLGGGEAFLTTETVRQNVTSESGTEGRSEKTIETSCAFPIDGSKNMLGWQRTCTYELGKTRPSDVRVYQVDYERF